MTQSPTHQVRTASDTGKNITATPLISLVSHPDYDIPLPDGHRFPATKFSRLVSRLHADGIVGQFVPLQPEPVNPWLCRSHRMQAILMPLQTARWIVNPSGCWVWTWSRVLANRSFLAVNGTLLAARHDWPMAWPAMRLVVRITRIMRMAQAFVFSMTLPTRPHVCAQTVTFSGC